MKRFSKMMLLVLGFGLLALVLSSIPSRLALADDYRTEWPTVTMPTHLGIRPGNLVVLDCTAFSSAQVCTQYNQIGKDGSVTTYSGPPRGFGLLVTDVSWQSFGNTPGNLEGVTLENLGGGLHLFANDETADSNGDASGNIHFTAGVIYAGVPYIIVNTANPQLQVIGYNVPY